MKALKDCKWEVDINESIDGFYFSASTFDNCGELLGFMMPNYSKTRKLALSKWRKFAKLNGITNYKITGRENEFSSLLPSQS